MRAGETELAGADRYLRDWHRTPVAAEAVWFSSRGAAGALAAYALGRPGSATTRRVALRYLQRLATKNETTSFFGPFQYGAVTDGAGTALLAFDAASPGTANATPSSPATSSTTSPAGSVRTWRRSHVSCSSRTRSSTSTTAVCGPPAGTSHCPSPWWPLFDRAGSAPRTCPSRCAPRWPD